MAVSSPMIYSNGEVIGVLRYVTSVRKGDSQIIQVALVSCGVLVAVLAAVLISSNYYLRSIMNPVAEITEKAQRIASGSYGVQIKTPYRDEIGELADTINEMSNKISQNEKVQTDFISSLSHELRTPLTSIKGACETVMDDPEMPQETRQYFLDMALTESDRMTRIVSDLLVLSRLDNKRTQWKLETFDAAKSVQRLIEVMRVDIDARRHEVTFTAQENIPPLTVDKERVEQVVINILSNSVKYTPEGGKIDVSVTSAEEKITIRIADNGIGIPEEDLAHVFERFYRVEKSRTSETGGTGLGLAIAKELIEAHGGSISMESSLGKGSAVTIVLPAVCNPA